MLMSDLYLVLRHRLEAVAEWVELGSEQLLAAQKALGLSDERAARLVPVATRTWIRWRQRGAVPIYMLSRVAEVLELEIERPERTRITLEDPPPDRLEEVLALVEEMHGWVRELREMVEARLEEQPRSQPDEPPARSGS
jgi:hypothetical protein